MLSGEEILKQIELGNISIEPFDKECVGANGYTLHLGNELVVYEEDVLECKKSNKTRVITIPEEGCILRPGELYLSKTAEYTKTNNHVPMLSGRLSVGLLGLTVHITAGFGDNGFEGTWTLEMCCIKPVKIYPNMKICHICYFPIVGEGNIKYRGKYYKQVKTTASKIEEDFSEVEV